MLSALPSSAIDRLAAIAARTASEADGEALSAARLLTRELAKAGLRIDDVIRRGVGGPPLPPSSPSPTTRAAEDHRDLAADALNTPLLFNASELAFIRSMRDAPRASEKQRSWLASLAARSRNYRSAMSGARAC